MSDAYQGSEAADWETYCVLGAKNRTNGEELIHQRLTGQDAYDHFALALYLKQLISFCELTGRSDVRLEDIQRKEKILFLYEIFRIFDFRLRYLELGSTVFEIIDGIRMMASLENNRDPTPDISFYGIERSGFLRSVGKYIHKGSSIKYVNDVEDAGGIDVLYDRAVSSYMTSESSELARFLNMSRIGYANLLLSRTVSFDIVNDVGKAQTFFGIPELVNNLCGNLYYLFGRERDDTSVEGFFIYTRDIEIDTIMQSFRRSPLLDRFMAEKDVAATPAGRLARSVPPRRLLADRCHFRAPLDARLASFRAARGSTGA
ncbi:MAG: hypothetical protein HYV63_01455 [Candidatus Schekmanbacteria bacterium]|nr:hypothetical protein [Candidatus Schekmanbacteria bacterium]